MISRRSFIGTMAAAVAVGFAKLETAIVENAAVDWGLATGDYTAAYTYRGVPVVADAACPHGTIYFVSKRGLEGAIIDIGGASGDPTSRE